MISSFLAQNKSGASQSHGDLPASSNSTPSSNRSHGHIELNAFSNLLESRAQKLEEEIKSIDKELKNLQLLMKTAKGAQHDECEHRFKTLLEKKEMYEHQLKGLGSHKETDLPNPTDRRNQKRLSHEFPIGFAQDAGFDNFMKSLNINVGKQAPRRMSHELPIGFKVDGHF